MAAVTLSVEDEAAEVEAEDGDAVLSPPDLCDVELAPAGLNWQALRWPPSPLPDSNSRPHQSHTHKPSLPPPLPRPSLEDEDDVPTDPNTEEADPLEFDPLRSAWPCSFGLLAHARRWPPRPLPVSKTRPHQSHGCPLLLPPAPSAPLALGLALVTLPLPPFGLPALPAPPLGAVVPLACLVGFEWQVRICPPTPLAVGMAMPHHLHDQRGAAELDDGEVRAGGGGGGGGAMPPSSTGRFLHRRLWPETPFVPLHR